MSHKMYYDLSRSKKPWDLRIAGPVSAVSRWRMKADGTKGRRLKDQPATIYDSGKRRAVLLVER